MMPQKPPASTSTEDLVGMPLFSRLLPFLSPYRFHMIIAASMAMGVAALNLFLLRLAGILWDVVTVQRNVELMTQTLMLFLGIAATHSILAMGHSYLTTHLAQHVMADFRTHLFAHVQRLSLCFFAQHRTGEILSRVMNDVGVIQTLITDTPIDSVKHLVTFIGGISFLLYMNWTLCGLILLLLPALVLVARLFGKRLKALSTQIQDRTASLTTLIEEVFSGIRVVKSFVQTTYEKNRFGMESQALISVTLRRAKILSLFIPTITLLTFVMASVVMWYGGKQVIDESMTPGDLLAFVLFAGILIGPFGSAARLFSHIKEAQGAMQRICELLDTSPVIMDTSRAFPLPPVEGHIQFSHVSFDYDPRQPVLTDLSFEIRPGELVALVGPTGSGKTTIANLLHRFYDPSTGNITIDGHDLRNVQLDSWYRQIALVPQETILFGGTIFNNIRYGRESATEQDVLNASHAAHAHAFISALPDGYDTMVGEKGMNLSGGQRQRLAIARAIVKNPRLLILDEATAALDAESELLVQDALRRLLAGRTTLVIAHRLTTIQEANHIFVIKQGQIVESGTHATLMHQGGMYHHLYTLRLAELETETLRHPN